MKAIKKKTYGIIILLSSIISLYAGDEVNQKDFYQLLELGSHDAACLKVTISKGQNTLVTNLEISNICDYFYCWRLKINIKLELA